MVEQERVGREREPERDQPERVQRRLVELRRRHVERPEHRDRRPFPEDRPVRARPEERREHEDAEAARQRAVEVDAAPLRRRAQADGEQHDRASSDDRPEPVGEQRRACPAAARSSGCGARAHGTLYRRSYTGAPLRTKRTGSPAVCAEQLAGEPRRPATHLEHVRSLANGRGKRLAGPRRRIAARAHSRGRASAGS